MPDNRAGYTLYHPSVFGLEDIPGYAIGQTSNLEHCLIFKNGFLVGYAAKRHHLPRKPPWAESVLHEGVVWVNDARPS